MPDVRLATLDDRRALGTTLAAAFEDDPVWRWLVPSPTRWAKRAAAMFTADVGNRIRQGSTFTTAGLAGAAEWAPPGRWRPTTADMLREMPAALALLGTGSVRGMKFLTRMEKAHPREEHWYLAVLGTHPDQQGKGIGSALMRPILDRCDEQGIPAYLESSKQANIAFYARHGFVQRDPIETDGGPTLYPMWREPRS